MFSERVHQTIPIIASSFALTILLQVGRAHSQVTQSPVQPEGVTFRGSSEQEIADADKLAKAKRWPQAIAAYKRAIELDPNAANAHGNQGHVYSQTGQLQEAVTSLQRAIELQPDSPTFRYNLGNAYLTMNRPAESVELFEQAIRLKPDYFQAYNDLGNAFAQLRRYREAMP